MSKIKKGSTVPCPPQVTLFPPAPPPAAEGSLEDLPHAIRAALVEVMKPLALSRWQVAGQVSELLGREISKSMLDAYCAESHDAHRLPADVAVAISVVAGNPHLLDVLALRARCVMVPLAEVQASDATADLRSGMLACVRELGEAASCLEEALKDGALTRAELLGFRRELRDLIKAACAVSSRIEEAV